MFYCKIWEIWKKTYFKEHLQMSTSGSWRFMYPKAIKWFNLLSNHSFTKNNFNKIFFSKMIKSAGNGGFGHIYWGYPSWKTSFLYSVTIGETAFTSWFSGMARLGFLPVDSLPKSIQKPCFRTCIMQCQPITFK